MSATTSNAPPSVCKLLNIRPPMTACSASMDIGGVRSCSMSGAKESATGARLLVDLDHHLRPGQVLEAGHPVGMLTHKVAAPGPEVVLGHFLKILLPEHLRHNAVSV